MQSMTNIPVIAELEQAEEALEDSVAINKLQYQHARYDDLQEIAVGDAGIDEPVQSSSLPPSSRHREEKVGRNDPCPCGSGKKYKHCHGRMT